MTGNVVAIDGGAVPAREPNASCIALLADWLEMARSGEIIGVVAVGLSHDGCGQWALGGMVGGYSMLGALEIAKADLAEDIRGE